jgi:TRAP-type C4-dicarboxylate transport system substrate-binding protein
MRKTTLVSLLGALMLIVAGPASAQQIVVKVGTSAPIGSPWHTSLKTAAQKWKELSGDKVILRIFPGGTMGDEGDMVKKMRIGQLQASALSTIGLHDITAEPQALDSPLIVQTTEQRECLLKKMAPELEQALEQKGYIVLTWSEIGFTRFFSKTARPKLSDMQQSKLFCWNGDPASKDAWIAGGFKPVLLSAVDMVPSLNTGMIDAILYPPTVALAIRAHEKASHMLDLPYSTLTGATIIDKKTWDSIPADLRPKLKEVFVNLGKENTAAARQFEADSLAKMKTQGLVVDKVQDLDKWREVVQSVQGAVRGKVVPASTFDHVAQFSKACREQFPAP